ncbi:hypothetical protein VNO80_13121 [Phaseolus coccineus]|uniref:Uncharacterized protein n=1 Tax=Phaseolus coccineus TaxID=3886 RepID=A0AAN9N0H5_PHACN
MLLARYHHHYHDRFDEDINAAPPAVVIDAVTTLTVKVDAAATLIGVKDFSAILIVMDDVVAAHVVMDVMIVAVGVSAASIHVLLCFFSFNRHFRRTSAAPSALPGVTVVAMHSLCSMAYTSSPLDCSASKKIGPKPVNRFP